MNMVASERAKPKVQQGIRNSSVFHKLQGRLNKLCNGTRMNHTA